MDSHRTVRFVLWSAPAKAIGIAGLNKAGQTVEEYFVDASASSEL